MDAPRTRHGLALLCACAVGVAAQGCQTEYDPPSLVNKLRVLGVRAEAPGIRLDAPSTLTPLVVGPDTDKALCWGWAFCPFAWSRDGNFQCIDADVQVDLGTAATVSVGVAHVFQAMKNADKVFKKLGLDQPTRSGTVAGAGPDLACVPGGKAPDATAGLGGGGSVGGAAFGDIPEMYVLFTVGTPAAWGGTCPLDASTMLSKPCPDRTRCLAGFKRLGLELEESCGPFVPGAEPACTKAARSCARKLVCGCDGKTYWNDCERVAAQVSRRSAGACANRNPTLAGIRFGVAEVQEVAGEQLTVLKTDAEVRAATVAWPADVTPVVAPDTVWHLLPEFDPADVETLGPSADPKKTKPDQETLLFSWYSTAGRFGRQRSTDASARSSLRAPVLDAGENERTVRVWVVVRDGRNGTDWLERRIMVRKGASSKGNPICATQAAAPGCPGR